MWSPLVLPPIIEISKLTLSALSETSVKPKVGSIVYCNIVPGYANHSGVYVGNGKIIHLASSGLIEEVSPERFMNAGFKLASCILVSCKGEESVGSEVVAKRAKDKLYSYREYNVLWNNCHQFCSGCLSGDFENSSNHLLLLESDCEKYLGFDNWCLWLWIDLDTATQEIEKSLTNTAESLKQGLEDIGEDIGEEIRDQTISLKDEFQEIREEMRENFTGMTNSLKEIAEKIGKNLNNFLE